MHERPFAEEQLPLPLAALHLENGRRAFRRERVEKGRHRQIDEIAFNHVRAPVASSN